MLNFKFVETEWKYEKKKKKKKTHTHRVLHTCAHTHSMSQRSPKVLFKVAVRQILIEKKLIDTYF